MAIEKSYGYKKKAMAGKEWHKGRKQSNTSQDVLVMGCFVLLIVLLALREVADYKSALFVIPDAR
jgi:hypothetical protein